VPANRREAAWGQVLQSHICRNARRDPINWRPYLYGAERIVCGTDGTEFGCEWTSKALAEAEIGEDARAKILHRNAMAMMSRLAKVAQRETVAA